MKRLHIDKNALKVVVATIVLTLTYNLFADKIQFLHTLSLKTSDVFARFTYRLKPKPKEIKDIVIIAIDDESYTVLQRKWPWPRSIFATFLDYLNEYKPKVVSLDLTFIGESPDKNDDLMLAKSLKNSANAILSGYIAPNGKYNKPLQSLIEASLGLGFINKPRDKDMIVRSTRVLFPRQDEKTLLDMSFGLKTCLKFLDLNTKNVHLDDKNLLIYAYSGNLNTKKTTLKLLKVPITDYGTTELNFQAKFRDFKIISFHKIINKQVAPEDIAGKIIVVGATAEIFHDVYHTPLGIMPGVVLNANEILMYLSGNVLNAVPKNWQFLLTLIVALLTAILTYKLKIFKGLLVLILELAGLFAISLGLSYLNRSGDYFGLFFIACSVYLGTETFKYVRLLVEATVLKTMAITDGLTGLYVHRYLILKLEAEFNRAKEENSNLSFLIMDIDHFKNINDTYGHEEGNVILKNIAKILQDASRRVDIVARYGGEEFCAILPSTTEKGANIYAERIRKAIEEFNFPYKENQPIKATISIGIASLNTALPQTPQDLIAFADKALYQAKETGRNKVCVFVPPPEQNKNIQ